jgi:exonuclease SbcD
MRILHTSDWHLGHALHDVERGFEHAQFLAWLLDRIEEYAVDALLIAGDVFDSANPPAFAQAAWYGFLGAARARAAALEVVVIGGNHDSPSRLDAPAPILAPLRVHVVGGMVRHGARRAAAELVCPLRGPSGEVEVCAAAVPYLRPADLPPGMEETLEAGVREVYAQVFDLARQQFPGVPLVAMGHCYMAGTALSELSERKILGGNQHALPSDLFPPDVAYAALGHLHKAQRVASAHVPIHYSGSPIPLAMTERVYDHQVLLVDVEPGSPARVTPLPVPRWVPFVRVPPRGPGLSLEATLGLLRALDLPEPLAGAPAAFVEVALQLQAPEPSLRAELQAALHGKHARVVKVQREVGTSHTAEPQVPAPTLRELTVEAVFLHAWRRAYDTEPPAAVLAALHEAIDAVGQGVGAQP